MLPLPFVCPVSGVKHLQDEVFLVDVGDQAVIVHDPENPFDKNACKVLVKGRMVGFVPKELAARLVCRGEKSWDGKIVEKTGQDLKGLRLKVLEPQAEQKPQPEKPREEVFSLSGRSLGVLVSIEGDTATVENSKGVKIPYPLKLVKIEPPRR